VVKSFWNESKYDVKDVSRLMFAKEFIFISHLTLINHFFNNAKIQLTQKDRKKGKQAIFSRLKKRFYQKRVRLEIDTLMEQITKEIRKDILNDPTIESIDEQVDRRGFDITYWTIVFYLKNEPLKSLIEREYPFDTLSYYLRAYKFSVDEKFDLVMERPQELSVKEQHVTDQLMLENKKLKKENIQSIQKKFYLENSIFELKQKNKKLEKTLQNLYDDALNEIELLKQEVEQLKSDFDTERTTYFSVIETLAKQLNEEDFIEQKECDLSNSTICVIGGSKERSYKHVVEKYNGNIRFVPVDQYKKIEGAVSDSDVIFFLTDMVGHQHFYKSFELSKRLNKPFVFVNSLGISTFERKLKTFIKN
jgi:hypothetical protein